MSLITPTTPLTEYLRSYLYLTGTKIGCAEGGCGACTVLIEKGGKTMTANACLRPVFSLDGANVTTTEGLGSTNKGYDPIQSKIAECDGSQCGYCSPGFVMAMKGLLTNNPNPDAKTIETQFQGNICRCSGYRPILNAMHSISTHSCVDHKEQVCSHEKVIDIEDLVSTRSRPRAMNNVRARERKVIVKDGSTWVNPADLDDLWHVLDDYAGQAMRLVVGSTSTGVALPLLLCFTSLYNSFRS